MGEFLRGVSGRGVYVREIFFQEVCVLIPSSVNSYKTFITYKYKLDIFKIALGNFLRKKVNLKDFKYLTSYFNDLKWKKHVLPFQKSLRRTTFTKVIPIHVYHIKFVLYRNFQRAAKHLELQRARLRKIKSWHRQRSPQRGMVVLWKSQQPRETLLIRINLNTFPYLHTV